MPNVTHYTYNQKVTSQTACYTIYLDNYMGRKWRKWRKNHKYHNNISNLYSLKKTRKKGVAVKLHRIDIL